MNVHVVHSPTHGDLRVITGTGMFGQGRTWRAVLDPAPARLAHLQAVDGNSEGDALERLTAVVERYDAHGTGVVGRGGHAPAHDDPDQGHVGA